MNLTGSLKSQHKIYKVAALPVACLLAFLLHTPQGLTWLDAGVLGFALASIGELISLPAWYSCRVAPIDRTPVWRLLATHIMAAQILSFLWLGVGKLIARALSYVPALQGFDARFDQRMTIVYGAGCVFYLLALSFLYGSVGQGGACYCHTRPMVPVGAPRESELMAFKDKIKPHS